MACPFCNLPDSDVTLAMPLVVALRDRFPVSPGHTLIVTRRHVPTGFELDEAERQELWRALDLVKTSLDREFHPDGYNVGFNVDEAAGQTVMHFHLHVIPRCRGDVGDPRGGVRHVIPAKGNYLRGPDERA